MKRTSMRLVAGAVVALGGALVMGGCDSSKGRADAYYVQASANRGAAATAMAADWRAKKLLLDDCLNLAFHHIDTTGDQASLVFAGAVLDFAQMIEQDLPQSGDMEILWIRIGGLAGAAGEKAYSKGDLPLARSLVLAGPGRWKTDMYWLRHPNHDALASYVLYGSGEAKEAVSRLRSRADLDEAPQRALDEIQAAMRNQPQ